MSAVGPPKQDGNLGSRWRRLAVVSTISGSLPVPGIGVMSAQASRGELGVLNPHSKGVCLAVESPRGDTEFGNGCHALTPSASIIQLD